MRIRELLDIFGLAVDEFLDSVDRDENAAFRRALYNQAASQLGGSVWDARRGNYVDLPPETEMEDEQLREWLGYVALVGDLPDWEIPPVDLILPRTAELSRQLAALSGDRPRAKWVVALTEYVGAEGAIYELERRVSALRALMAKRKAYIEKQIALPMACRRLCTLMQFQRQHWRSELRRQEKDGGLSPDYEHQIELRLASVDRIAASASELEGILYARVMARHRAEEAALAGFVMDVFDPRMDVGATFAQLLQLWVLRPTAISAKERTRLLRALEDAFGLVAASEKSDEFLRSHFLPLFESVCEGAGPRIEASLAAAKAQSVAVAVVVTWRDAIDAARRGMADVGATESNLVILSDAANVTRAVAGVVAAALHDRFVSRFLYFSMVGFGASDTAAGVGAFGTTLLRFLGAVAEPNRTVDADSLKLGPVAFADLVDLVYDSSAGDASAQARIKRLQMADRFMRTPRGIALNFIIDFAAFSYAIAAPNDNATSHSISVLTSLASMLTAPVLKVAELQIARSVARSADFAAEAAATSELKGIQAVSKHVTAVIAVFTVVASLSDRSRRVSKGATHDTLWYDDATALATCASLAGSVLETALIYLGGEMGALELLSASLGIAGAIAGLALIGVGVVRAITARGAGPLTEAHVSFVVGGREEFGRYRAFDQLERALADAVGGDALSVFRRFKGTREDGGTMGVPTWHRVCQFGFSPHEVEILFDDGAARQVLEIEYGIQKDPSDE